MQLRQIREKEEEVKRAIETTEILLRQQVSSHPQTSASG